MGLYISSHPLDRYETYFAEQTHSYDLVTAENDGKQLVIGGIISAVRTILTKSGTRMAFVKLENKIAEQEVIIFPNLYEEVGAKLEQDNVIKVTGRVNAKDKDGNVTSEVKIIADTVEIVPDTVLEEYQPTGQKLPVPKEAAPRRASRSRATSVGGSGARGGYQGGVSYGAKAGASAAASDAPRAPITPPRDTRGEKLYVLIQDAENVEVLSEVRRLCELNPGVQEIIMVLKDENGKRPLKLPFRVDVTEELTKPLSELLGEGCVKVQ